MLKDKLTLMIHSCDKFSDLWDAHITLLNQNWSDRNIETYLVTDKNTEKEYENIKIVATGEGKELSERIKAIIPQIGTEYILVTLDDYFNIYPIDNKKIEALISVMEKEKLDYICIFDRPKTKIKKKGYKTIYEVDLTKNYRVNLYPGIWRKDFMEKTIREPLNAWMYEASLTKIAQELNARCVQSKGKEFLILDVVRKGKILRKANRYLRKHDLYHGSRPVRTRREEFKLFIITWTVRLLPKKIIDWIKKKFKVKSYSGTK